MTFLYCEIECDKTNNKKPSAAPGTFFMARNLPNQSVDFVSVIDALPLADAAQFLRMPYCLRVFAENIIRKQPADVAAPYLQALAARRHDIDFPYYPARVVLQD